ncbi:MAG: sulfatase-like hydrolase/transferase, partial [Planctomycetaceae bacterium]|nr:sulfatase-like hydrolase/transferase [Planctomycetaceae bacterium]
LRTAGYYCTNRSKTDYQFAVPKEAWDESGGRAHWRNRPDPDQPFFAVFNFTTTHESRIASDSRYQESTQSLTKQSLQDPAKLTTLPPYYADTPVVRKDWARNYDLIRAMDLQAGDLLEQLKQDGLSDNTIVIFWSDHGIGLPRGKRWLYDSGMHVPLIVRIPEKLRIDSQGAPGTVNDELVSLIDLAPTLLNLAGIKIPDVLQGRAFLGKNLSEPRKYVYGARDRMDERYDI